MQYNEKSSYPVQACPGSSYGSIIVAESLEQAIVRLTSSLQLFSSN